MRIKLFFTILIFTASVLVATAMPAQAAIVDYWKFDQESGGTTQDETGNNILTVTGATRQSTGGFDGSGAYSFNGTAQSNKLQNASPISLPIGNSSRTMIAMVNPSSPINANEIAYGMPVVGWGTTDYDQSSMLRIYENHIKYVQWGGLNIDSLLTVPNGQWTQIAVTYDSSTGKVYLYVNGVQDSVTGATIQNTILDARGLVIGASCYNYELWFNGSIDEVGIFGGALSVGQISSLYFTYGGNIEQFELAGEPDTVPEPATMAGVAALVAFAIRRIRRKQ